MVIARRGITALRETLTARKGCGCSDRRKRTATSPAVIAAMTAPSGVGAVPRSASCSLARRAADGVCEEAVSADARSAGTGGRWRVNERHKHARKVWRNVRMAGGRNVAVPSLINTPRCSTAKAPRPQLIWLASTPRDPPTPTPPAEPLPIASGIRVEMAGALEPPKAS